jgi:putative transcriptional regulator
MLDEARQRAVCALGWLALLAALLIVPAAPGSAEGTGPDRATSLVGQFLVASPQMPDPRFARTVIYMVSHDPHGAMGLVINRGWGSGSLRALLQGFGIETQDDVSGAEATVRLHSGGPVEPGRGFVLHSADYAGGSTRVIGTNLALTTGTDILQAMAEGHGPSQRLFLLGYAGWGPGQLERELARDDWLVAPGDAARVFADDTDSLWQDVLGSAGTPL